MLSSILICGACARAAAFSCKRADFSPQAADCFADSDLRDVCIATRVDNYPHGFVDVVNNTSAESWMYTGGLENHPELVDRMATMLPLLGVSGESLRQVRDPWRLQAALVGHDLLSPPLAAQPPANTVEWLRKPIKSCGGANICRVDGIPAPATRKIRPAAFIPAAAPKRWYFQQFVDGAPLSAAYVAAAGRAVMLGACRQLVGEAWTGAGGFQYCGSIGPLALSEAHLRQFRRLGETVASEFALQGVFGIDVIQRRDRLWTLEVNPRYTSSMEVLEQALPINFAALHVAACRNQQLPGEATHDGDLLCGKAIIFARREIVAAEHFSAWARSANANRIWPRVADLPTGGGIIRAGHPVTTVFASANSSRQVLRGLRTLAGDVQRLLQC